MVLVSLNGVELYFNRTMVGDQQEPRGFVVPLTQ